MHRSRLIARITIVALATTLAVSTGTPAFAAMSRSLVMQRAQTWVDLRIPYSQTAYRASDGSTATVSTGWRTDCSGFVSMAWYTSQPGYSTRTLDSISDLITKEVLQPGDAMVAYDRHAVIFGGWVDAERTHYYAYEMSSGASKGTGDGTVMRETPYPYWPSYYPNDFKPYRLKGITENIDYSLSIAPIEGANRYATAVAASRSAFDTGTVNTVVVASGENWPDALGAAALAGAVGGPVLLTPPASLPAAVQREIGRLGATQAIVIGGAGAVSAGVLGQIDAIEGVGVRRIAGSNRYSTSAAVAQEAARLAGTGGFDGTVFIATGNSFPDALAASPLAAAMTRPILLTESERLSPETSATIAAMSVRRAVILGGTGPVSSQVASDLASVAPSAEVTRVAGRDRYETAAAVAALGVDECGLSYPGLAIATGEDFPDALAGGVMASAHGTVLALTPSDRLHPLVWRVLVENQSTMGLPRVLGGEGVLKPIVREAIALALQPAGS